MAMAIEACANNNLDAEDELSGDSDFASSQLPDSDDSLDADPSTTSSSDHTNSGESSAEGPTNSVGESSGEEESIDSGNESADEESTSAESGSSSSDADEGSTGDDDRILARNIELTMVEANQAVQVALATDGKIVDPMDRDVELIEGRPTYFRAHWDVPNDWKDRNIEAELVIAFPDGSEEVLTQMKMISKDSNPDRLDGSFTWAVEADSIVPDLNYSVTLYEVDGDLDDDSEPMPPPRFPREGLGSVGIIEGDMELKVVLIIASTESGPPNSTPEQRQKVEDEIFENYPIQKLDAEWRIEEHENFDGSRDGFKFLQKLREEDDADPNAYYHLFVSDKDHKFGWSGVANMAKATKQSASRRVAMTVARGSVDRGRSTVVHEIGHNHGRGHSPCGGAGGSNDDFPHPGARLGVPGLRIIAKEVITTEKYRDYMSYCRPRWPSDYYFQLNLERIRTLTSWDRHGNIEERSRERSLVGTIDTDGQMYWKLIRGRIGTDEATRDSNNFARLWTSEGVLINDFPIWRTQIEDVELQQVVIAVGTDFDAEQIEVSLGGKKYQASAQAVDIIAPPDH